MADHLDGDALIEYRLAEARKAVERGWALTPQISKRCYRPGWQSEQPAPLAMVLDWAKSGNIALRSGAVSQVIVVDDDSPAQNAALILSLPETPTVETGSGRRHHYYLQPDFAVRNSTGRLLPGVDVKGDGGAVTFVGSIHPRTGRGYCWVPGYSPDDVGLAALPEHILDKLRPPPAASRPPTLRVASLAAGTRPERYAFGALRGAALRVYDAREGTRNSTLNREAFGLARFISAGLLPREQVEDALGEAARAAGLPDPEVASTLRSALDSGLRLPRPIILPEVRP